MKLTSIETIASWTHGEVKGSASVTGLQVDSRLIQEGDLFVCLVGERVDGHDYAQVAIDKGAKALLVDHYLDLPIPQIRVHDTLEGLRDLAKAYRNTLNAYFIAITGSNGKTSTKDILKSILERVGKTVVTYKNQNTEIGTYLNIFRMDETHEYGVFEMGLDMPGEVKTMNDFLQSDACIITSLAPTHIVNFENIEHIAREKFAIIDGVKDKTKVFYQGDYELYRALDKGYKTFGTSASNNYIVSDVNSNNAGITFKVNGEVYACNLLGEHQASNCAGIIGLMRALNIDDATIREGLLNVSLTALRTELVEKNEALVILDAYKSNPDSTRFALKLLKNYDYEGKRKAVLSDMRELGSDSLNYHIEILEEALRLELDAVYVYGPEFKLALDTVKDPEGIIQHFEDFTLLHQASQELFNHHDIILIKGSRYYALERLMEAL